MNLLGIAKKVGAGLIQTMIPGSGLLFDAANALLPPDKQIGEKTTGSELESIIDSLPEGDKATILAKQFDVEIKLIAETGGTLRRLEAPCGQCLRLTQKAPIQHDPRWLWACVILFALP